MIYDTTSLKIMAERVGLITLIPLGGTSKEMLSLRFTPLLSFFIPCLYELCS